MYMEHHRGWSVSLRRWNPVAWSDPQPVIVTVGVMEPRERGGIRPDDPSPTGPGAVAVAVAEVAPLRSVEVAASGAPASDSPNEAELGSDAADRALADNIFLLVRFGVDDAHCLSDGVSVTADAVDNRISAVEKVVDTTADVGAESVVTAVGGDCAGTLVDDASDCSGRHCEAGDASEVAVNPSG